MNLTHLRKARALWAVALLGAIALAGVKVAAGQYTVYDDHAVQIGKAGAVSGGDTIGYVDDPNQNHPPNTNAVYNWDASLGTYSDGNGYHVEFTVIGGGAGYLWVKRDSDNHIVDAGTMG